MNPTLTSYVEDVSKAKELVNRIETDNDSAAKKELLELSQKIEKDEKILAKEVIEITAKEQLHHAQQEYNEMLAKINFEGIKTELGELTQTITQTEVTAGGIVTTETTEGIVDAPNGEIDEKGKKNFLEKTRNGLQGDRKDENYGKLALKTAGIGLVAYGTYKAISRIANAFSGDKNEAQDGGKDSRRKKGLKWLGIGAIGVGVFSQWDNINNWIKEMFGKSSTSNETITNAEQQKEDRDDLDSPKKEAYEKVGSNILDYHSMLNPNYDQNVISAHNPDIVGITPMLLDGMYGSIAEMTDSGSMTSEKRRQRREQFNTMISNKSNEFLKYMSGSILESIGIGENNITAEGLTQEGRELIDANKDKLRKMQTQGFMDTKLYLHHIKGRIARSLTATALEKQGKESSESSIDDALLDDSFQKKYVEKELQTLLSSTTLASLPAVLEKMHITPSLDEDDVQTAQKIYKEKHELVGNTFNTITSNEKINENKEALISICQGAQEVTQDTELRENTNIWLSDVYEQILGTDDAIRDRVTENLGANLRWDAYSDEINSIQDKITLGTADVDDITRLEVIIDSMYQFKQQVLLGQEMMIEVEEKDGTFLVNLVEGGDTMYQWALREHNGKWDYALTVVGIGTIAYPILRPLSAAKVGARVAIGTLRIGGKVIKIGAGASAEVLQTAFQEKIRRFNYRRSAMPGVNYFQLRQYGKNPEAMMKAFQSGYLSLDDAAAIAAKKSKDTTRNKFRRKKRGESNFSDNIAHNRNYLLKKTFTDTTADLGLLEKHVDSKTRRGLLFKNNNHKGKTFVEIQDMMKRYDVLLENRSSAQASLSPQQTKLVKKIIHENRLSLKQLDVILDEAWLKQIHNIDTLDDAQLTKLARQIPSILKQKNTIAAFEKSSDLIKMRSLGLKDMKSIKKNLSKIIAEQEKAAQKLSGPARKTADDLIAKLKLMEKADDADLQLIIKEGYFKRFIQGTGSKISPLSQRLSGLKNSKLYSALFKSKGSRLAGKILGRAFMIGDIALSGYGLYEARQDEEELGPYNPTKQQLKIEKNILSTGLATAGLALVFIPGVGWVAAAATVAAQFATDAYFETMEHYTTNLEEFTRQSKPVISNHILTTLSGRSGDDKGFKESFAEFTSGKDLDYMGALVGDDAIEGRLRVDQMEHLTPDQLIAVQFHLAPSAIKQEIFSHIQEQDSSANLGLYKQEASEIFDTLVKKPAQVRYNEIKEKAGTMKVTSKHGFGVEDMMIPPLGIAKLLFGKQTQSTDEVINLESIAHANTMGQGYEALQKLLNGGEYAETHENTPQTLDGIYHALWLIARDVHHVHIGYTVEEIQGFYKEADAETLGLYFTDDGEVGVSNERELDKTFSLSELTTDHGRKEIIEEITEAVEENDLITTKTGSNEERANQEIGNTMIAIFKNKNIQPKAPTI